jgi:hypothetical protein
LISPSFLKYWFGAGTSAAKVWVLFKKVLVSLFLFIFYPNFPKLLLNEDRLIMYFPGPGRSWLALVILSVIVIFFAAANFPPEGVQLAFKKLKCPSAYEVGLGSADFCCKKGKSSDLFDLVRPRDFFRGTGVFAALYPGIEKSLWKFRVR